MLDRGIRRAAKATGQIDFDLVSDGSVGAALRAAGGRVVLAVPGLWAHAIIPGASVGWTREGLVREIEASGFEVLDCRPVVGPFAATTLVRSAIFWRALRGTTAARTVAAIMNVRALVEDAATPDALKTDNACAYVVVAQRST